MNANWHVFYDGGGQAIPDPTWGGMVRSWALGALFLVALSVVLVLVLKSPDWLIQLLFAGP